MEIFRLPTARIKTNQIPFAIFQVMSKFSLNFALLFNVATGHSSVLFYLKLFMIWRKENHQSAKFQTFECSREIWLNLYFDRILLLQFYKISVKKSCFKMTSIWWILTWSSGNLQIFTLISSLCTKHVTFDLKKYRGVIFHETEEWCKVWRKTELWLWKWYEEYGEFSPEHLKVSQLGFWKDPFIQSRKFTSLKSAEELCVMTMKNKLIFEKRSTCHFKFDMRNVTNCDPNTQKSRKLVLQRAPFEQNILIFGLKKYRRVTFDSTENWGKIWRRID